MSKKKYILEYWIDLTNYSKESLEIKLTKDLEKIDVNTNIEEEPEYFVLYIKADQKNIDACHDQLSFNRHEVYRANDELGDYLRSKAYPVLSEIETRLRIFISNSMIEVLGFSWWDTSISKKIRENVNKIEGKLSSKQATDHPIEFTMFDDLIDIVTHSFQRWPDEKNITSSDLAKLLEDCNSFEELNEEIKDRRKTISIWENVFSKYFRHKEAWSKLKYKIENTVIPIRNKVMHHRLIRLHDLRQLEECRDEVNKIIGSAKTKLPKAELEEALKNISTAFESIRFQLDPKVINALTQPIINQKIIENLQRPLIDPEVLKVLQEPLIDPKMLKGIMPKINFGLHDLDNDPDTKENDESNGDGKSDQDDEGNDPKGDENDEDEK